MPGEVTSANFHCPWVRAQLIAIKGKGGRERRCNEMLKKLGG